MFRYPLQTAFVVYFLSLQIDACAEAIAKRTEQLEEHTEADNKAKACIMFKERLVIFACWISESMLC